MAKLGANGAVSLYDYADFGGTDLVVDVVGYFEPGGGAVTAIDPQRLLDTRTGLDTTAAPFASGESPDGAGGRPGRRAGVGHRRRAEPHGHRTDPARLPHGVAGGDGPAAGVGAELPARATTWPTS